METVTQVPTCPNGHAMETVTDSEGFELLICPLSCLIEEID